MILIQNSADYEKDIRLIAAQWRHWAGPQMLNNFRKLNDWSSVSSLVTGWMTRFSRPTQHCASVTWRDAAIVIVIVRENSYRLSLESLCTALQIANYTHRIWFMILNCLHVTWIDLWKTAANIKIMLSSPTYWQMTVWSSSWGQQILSG